MKTLKYPKTYATFVERFTKCWRHEYREEDYGYRFRAADGTTIDVPYWPSRSGHKPKRLYREWHQLCRDVGYRKAVDSYFFTTSEPVKLYQRNGRWYYRHLGE